MKKKLFPPNLNWAEKRKLNTQKYKQKTIPKKKTI